MQNSPYLDRPIRTIEQAQADIARRLVTLSPRPDRNGDSYWSVCAGPRHLGTVRHNKRTGDYQAVCGAKSRFFNSQRAAVNWLKRINKI